MSSPDSTIAVETSTSACPVMNLTITASSSRSFSWPWAITTRASGAIFWMKRAIEDSDWMRLWTKNTCPPRWSSRSSASRTTSRLNRQMWVSTGSRSSGAVSITERSRTPESDM